MKLNVYQVRQANSGVLEKTQQSIILHKHGWEDKEGTWHPLLYEKIDAFRLHNVYVFRYFGNKDSKGIHVALSFWENQRFKLMQGKHFFQSAEAWKFIIPVVISIVALVVSIIALKSS